MRTLRASELGEYLYCQRAWWYRIQGAESENQIELARGSDLHTQHGRAILASGLLKVIAYILFFAALLVFSVYLYGLLF